MMNDQVYLIMFYGEETIKMHILMQNCMHWLLKYFQTLWDTLICISLNQLFLHFMKKTTFCIKHDVNEYVNKYMYTKNL